MATFALVIASAASTYSFTIFEKSTLNGKELKPGEYKVELKGNTAIVKQGKSAFEAPVRVETTGDKASISSVKYVDGVIREIRLGGTKTKLIFEN